MRKSHGMSAAFAYRFEPTPPPSSLRDLDDVLLTVAVTDYDGRTIPAGTEGTIVSVFRDGAAYVVEFGEPEGALASVRPEQVRRVEHDGP